MTGTKVREFSTGKIVHLRTSSERIRELMRIGLVWPEKESWKPRDTFFGKISGIAKVKSPHKIELRAHQIVAAPEKELIIHYRDTSIYLLRYGLDETITKQIINSLKGDEELFIIAEAAETVPENAKQLATNVIWSIDASNVFAAFVTLPPDGELHKLWDPRAAHRQLRDEMKEMKKLFPRAAAIRIG